ncbi:MAG: PDC sensor domain-containing protein [Candidatus Omnitrophica bacterium]|nr:PDC sensor domain-containing protein [Candidatus Omnitrophota bacterium]MDD5574997.1 PDC sensor domain-containing protein [Candidatus Omnitrophota bacterium]
MKRLLVVFVCALVFLGALGHILFYEYIRSEKFQDTRERLMLVASNAALSIDAEKLLRVPLRMDGDKSQEYKDIFETLLKIKEINPFVRYVYIMTAADQQGAMQYMVDADPLPEIVTAKGERAFPGDIYRVERSSEMYNAFNGPAADKAFTTDGWGMTLSGYAPIRDESGKAVAILCVDIDASRMSVRQKAAQKALFFFWSLAFLLVLAVLADLFLKMKAKPEGGQG